MIAGFSLSDNFWILHFSLPRSPGLNWSGNLNGIRSCMNIFVTGATGFIGSYLVRKLHKSAGPDDRIYCFVRDPTRLPVDIAAYVIPLKGSDADIKKYTKEINSCEYLYHVGANPQMRGRSSYSKDNIEFTDAFISAAAGSVVLQRFVFISSNAATDRAPDDPCLEAVTEETVPHPNTEYGRSKLLCEKHLAESGLPYTIIRPTMVYGPGMRANSHIRVFIKTVRNGSPVAKIYFPGKISLIHVEDLVDAVVLAGSHPDALNQIYFVTDGKGIAIGEVFRIIGRMLGRNAGSIHIGFGIPSLMRAIRPYLPVTAQNLFSHLLWTSSEKIERLGFKPKHVLSDSLLETVHWDAAESRKYSPVAAVTGGAGGIGFALSSRLYAEGYSLILADRNEPELRNAAQCLHAESVVANLSSEEETDRFAAYLSDRAEQIDLLVNNAGIGRREKYWADEFSRQKDIVSVNILAPMKLVHSLLRRWTASGQKKHIVMMSSSAAFQPLAFMSVYSASKTMLLYVSEGIAEELRREGKQVEILTVCPSGTATNFQQSSGVKRPKHEKLLSPEYVADRIFRSIGRGSGTMYIGSSGTLMSLLARILPRSAEAKLWGHLMKERR